MEETIYNVWVSGKNVKQKKQQNNKKEYTIKGKKKTHVNKKNTDELR